MRHLLGAFGVLAAGVLLAVSAAMNWRFGYQMGKTELDGFIYGSASAAADCMKALVPFFFFAAIRNRMWSQAIASAIVGVVVTAYSLTSALGHAALNRIDTTGQRTVAANAYQDLRSDLTRTQEQLSWVPKHRPAAAIESELANTKNQKAWSWTNGCTDVQGKQGRTFCEQYNSLVAELASAEQAAAYGERIAGIEAKLAGMAGVTISAQADPQAAVLTKLAGLVIPGVKLEDVQTAMAVFIALLLEVGSTFGMYIAFSQWRLYDVAAPAAPKMATVASNNTAAAAVAVVPASQPAAPVQIAKPRSGANDNSVAAPAVSQPQPQPQRLVAPETDVERFYRENVETQDGSSLTATALYEEYCAWCEQQTKEPLALPTFGREFGELGVQKAKVAGRVRYIGIALKTGLATEEDKKLTALRTEAA